MVTAKVTLTVLSKNLTRISIAESEKSEFIVTEPVGGVEQDDFLNGCLELETLYTRMNC